MTTRDEFWGVRILGQTHLSMTARKLSLFCPNHLWPGHFPHQGQTWPSKIGSVQWQLPGGVAQVGLNSVQNTPELIPTNNGTISVMGFFSTNHQSKGDFLHQSPMYESINVKGYFSIDHQTRVNVSTDHRSEGTLYGLSFFSNQYYYCFYFIVVTLKVMLPYRAALGIKYTKSMPTFLNLLFILIDTICRYY